MSAVPSDEMLMLEMRLVNIIEPLTAIALGIHMLGANHARAMQGGPPIFAPELFDYPLELGICLGVRNPEYLHEAQHFTDESVRKPAGDFGGCE